MNTSIFVQRHLVSIFDQRHLVNARYILLFQTTAPWTTWRRRAIVPCAASRTNGWKHCRAQLHSRYARCRGTRWTNSLPRHRSGAGPAANMEPATSQHPISKVRSGKWNVKDVLVSMSFCCRCDLLTLLRRVRKISKKRSYVSLLL